MRAIRLLLILDSALLLLLGASFIFIPKQVLEVFHFDGLPYGVNYMIALWGCVFATLGLGYFLAALNPLRNVAWVQVGIARGILECIVGLLYVWKGIVTFQQAGLGIVAGGAIAILYLVFYPRPEVVEES